MKDTDGTKRPAIPPAVFALPDLTPAVLQEWKPQPGLVEFKDGQRTVPGLPFRMEAVRDGLRVKRNGQTVATIDLKGERTWVPLLDGRGVVLLTDLGTVQVLAVP